MDGLARSIENRGQPYRRDYRLAISGNPWLCVGKVAEPSARNGAKLAGTTGRILIDRPVANDQ